MLDTSTSIENNIMSGQVNLVMCAMYTDSLNYYPSLNHQKSNIFHKLAKSPCPLKDPSSKAGPCFNLYQLPSGLFNIYLCVQALQSCMMGVLYKYVCPGIIELPIIA